MPGTDSQVFANFLFSLCSSDCGLFQPVLSKSCKLQLGNYSNIGYEMIVVWLTAYGFLKNAHFYTCDYWRPLAGTAQNYKVVRVLNNACKQDFIAACAFMKSAGI